MKTSLGLIILIFVCTTSCFLAESDETKKARAEKECSQKTEINGLVVSFFGYFPQEADSVEVQIKRNNEIIEHYIDKIPEKVEDSLRHLRHYMINKKIALSDTLVLKIKNDAEKKVYDFQYEVRAQSTMLNRNWACVFYKLTIDGKMKEGKAVDFMKKKWTIIERKDFKMYYTETSR